MTKKAQNSIIKKTPGEVVEKEISPVEILKSLLKENNKKLKAVLGDNASSFMVSLVNLYQTDLRGAEQNSVLNAAFIAAALKLPIEKNLGFAYIIPYKKDEGYVAQFQLGYKGMVQLALRSGGVKKLNAIPIHDGQIKSFNPLTEEMEFDFSATPGEVIGYAAYMELVNGFNKTIYCSKEEIEQHAKNYSQSYKSDIAWSSKKSIWSTNFDEMALKTMLKKLLKFAPLSTEMQLMQSVDQASIKKVDINEQGQIEVVDTSFVDNKIQEVEEMATSEDIRILLDNSSPLKINLQKAVSEELGMNLHSLTKSQVIKVQEWIDKEIEKRM